MRTHRGIVAIIIGTVLGILVLGGAGVQRLGAKDRVLQGDPNDPTYRLYSLLDSKYNGKLDDFCVLAGITDDPKNPGQSQQRVIRATYNKDRGFGRLSIYLRTVAPLTPEQMKAYNAKQVYDFAESDIAKFTKTDTGTFGKQGDVYFEPNASTGALTSTPVTTEIQTQYEQLVTEYLLPALEKKAAGGNTP